MLKLSLIHIFLGKGSFIFKENPSMGGEDFSFFVENCKGAFYHVGCGNKEKKITSLIHTEDFDIEDVYKRQIYNATSRSLWGVIWSIFNICISME